MTNTFTKASMVLMRMMCLSFRQQLIVGMNQCSRDEYKSCQKKQSNEVSLPFYKLESVTEKWRTSLTAHS